MATLYRAKRSWAKFWMKHAGIDPFGRFAARMAALYSAPYKGRTHLAHITDRSFISPTATIHHQDLQLAGNVFIGDRVVIFQAREGGRVKIDKDAHIHSDCIIETGRAGSVHIGEDTHIQPHCQFSAYQGPITVGRWVQIAPNCTVYAYNHTFNAGELIKRQPLVTKGGVHIGDDAWIGAGVNILDGSRIGDGAVIGAGSTVTGDIPDQAVAVGSPAKVVKYRGD